MLIDFLTAFTIAIAALAASALLIVMIGLAAMLSYALMLYLELPPTSARDMTRPGSTTTHQPWARGASSRLAPNEAREED